MSFESLSLRGDLRIFLFNASFEFETFCLELRARLCEREVLLRFVRFRLGIELGAQLGYLSIELAFARGELGFGLRTHGIDRAFLFGLEELHALVDFASELLVARLLEYKKYKNAAAMLESRAVLQSRLHPRVYGPDPEFTCAMPDFLQDVPLESIAYVAASAFARRDTALLDSEHIAAKPIPVETHIRALHARIANRKHLRFSELVGPETPTPIVVVTFLAVLELYKRSMVNIRQDEAFGDIDIAYIEGSGELVFDDGADELAENGGVSNV